MSAWVVYGLAKLAMSEGGRSQVRLQLSSLASSLAIHQWWEGHKHTHIYIYPIFHSWSPYFLVEFPISSSEKNTVGQPKSARPGVRDCVSTVGWPWFGDFWRWCLGRPWWYERDMYRIYDTVLWWYIRWYITLIIFFISVGYVYVYI